MKLLWLCNCGPGVLLSHMTGKERGAVNWVDHVLSDLRKQNVTLRILFPGSGVSGELDPQCSYGTFQEGRLDRYHPELEQRFRQELETYQPDVIHSWGVEFSHALAMVNAAKSLDMGGRMVASIQGLCGVIARYYTQGLPAWAVHAFTLRDFLRQDNIAQQARAFARRGRLEEQTLEKLDHVMGRTHWDRACTQAVNPRLHYYHCRETLREGFYQGTWRYDSCTPHRIFASSCAYPVKGFHLLLEAFAQVLKTYPDATLAVPGKSFLQTGLRSGSYEWYLKKLVKKWGLSGKIQFLGKLSEEQMKEQYLQANAFALPSVMENSSNSLGEAMLLGVPSVAAWVGGVPSLMSHGQEGYLYAGNDPTMLAYYLCRIFEQKAAAEEMGAKAQVRARQTHDPQENLNQLLDVYRQVMASGEEP